MMGAQFEVEHTNFIAYLASDRPASPPRTTPTTLRRFLSSLRNPGSLISSSKGSDSDWTAKVAHAAAATSNELRWDDVHFLEPERTGQLLEPLRPHFAGYSLYALILPEPGYHSASKHRTREFFQYAAISSEGNALILMPREISSHKLAEVIDPFPAIKTLAETPVELPAALFWTRAESACALSLRDAEHLFSHELLPAMHGGRDDALDVIIRRASVSTRSKKLLHLSDLHFGRPEASLRRNWLKEHIRNLEDVDRVVITGDLFDTPSPDARDAFDDFRVDVEEATGKDAVVVPGNHDVRKRGNAFFGMGKNFEYVSDLGWNKIEVDEDLEAVFVCFNSSETGNFAKGSVTDRQRLSVGKSLDSQTRKRPELKTFMKIALVHHHPLDYESEPTALYERLIAAVFGGDERFTGFENSEAFLKWCASRGVDLILHGHKHVPHLAKARVSFPDKEREITVVGCGSTTGADNKPMCYDIISMDKVSNRKNVLFYHDKYGDGSGFSLQSVALDLRPDPIIW